MNNGYIASRVFGIPVHGMINVHGERLPEYQNAQSVIWPIYQAETRTGLTIHQIDDGIDSGEILPREEIPIRFCRKLEDTVCTTVAEIRMRTPRALRLVCENYSELRANSKPQAGGRRFTTPTIVQFWRMVRNNKRLYRQYAHSGRPATPQ